MERSIGELETYLRDLDEGSKEGILWLLLRDCSYTFDKVKVSPALFFL